MSVQENGAMLDADGIQRSFTSLLASFPTPDQAYLSQSSGAVSFAASTLTLPGQQWVFGTSVRNIPQQSFTVPTPSVTCATIAAGVPTIVRNPQQFAKLNIAVNNTSGGAVSGTLTITGNDERGAVGGAVDTITIGSTSNGTTSNTVSSKYFSSINSITAITGTLGNANVNITITEYQFRGNLKVDATGTPVFAWNNTYVTGDVKLCTFEVLAAGVLSVQDWRLLGPTLKAQRYNEIVDFCGGTPEGPPNWLGTCVYTACEGTDGHIFIAGNGGVVSEFDGQRFISTWRPTGLIGTDNIISCFWLGRNSLGKEIIFFGTDTGLVIRWNRTDNTYSSVAGWTAGKQVNRMVKGPGNSFVWAVGTSGLVFLISENGSAATMTSYTGNVVFPAGDSILAATTYRRELYVGGGTGTGMKFRRFNTENNLVVDLSPYVPGTAAERGTGVSASVPAVYAMDVAPNGKILLAGLGANSFWLAEWDCNQQFATGELQVTTSGAATIPAGTTYSNGTKQFKTVEASSTSGAGTVLVPAVAVLPGETSFVSEATVTTIVDAVANVTTVTNTTPFGMGRFIGSGSAGTGEEGIPATIISNTPLDLCWTGRRWILAMQGGDIMEYDGSRLRLLTDQFSFKGRATGAFRGSKRALVYGDEGKVFSLPH